MSEKKETSKAAKVKPSRYEYLVLCNGGPNDQVVGRTKDTLGKACGSLESMMKVLGANFGQIVRSDSDQYEPWKDSGEPVYEEADE